MSKIEYRTGYDWQALFIDGKKVAENHSLKVQNVLEALSEHGLIEYSHVHSDIDPDESNENYLMLEKFFEE